MSSCSVACYKQHKGPSTRARRVSSLIPVLYCRDVFSRFHYERATRAGYALPSAFDARVHTSSLPPSDPASNPEGSALPQPHPDPDPDPQPLQDRTPLRPLTALKWPYVPDISAFPDPLTRDDPKALQLHQYEAIGTFFFSAGARLLRMLPLCL